MRQVFKRYCEHVKHLLATSTCGTSGGDRRSAVKNVNEVNEMHEDKTIASSSESN